MQTIIHGDCLKEMKRIDSQSIDVVVTSCPYNIGIKYNTYEDNKSQDDYLEWMFDVCKEIKRILKDDGSFFLNVGGTNANPSIPWDICNTVRDLFFLQNNIVWVKSISIDKVSFGHFKPINSGRFLNNNHESIFHFTKKGTLTIDRLAIGVPYKDKSNIGRYSSQDLRCDGNVWFIPYKTVKKKKQHPAGFPEELPARCIKLHGINENTVVLDPFLGAGTTLLACEALNVKGIGIELDEKYCEEAKEKLTCYKPE